MSHGQKRKQLMEANTGMDQLLELSERDFKITMISMVTGSVEKVDNMGTVKKMEILEIKY